MKKSLLTHIASNFISEYENVANSSVAYLLNLYPQARTALQNLLDIEKVPTHYDTELSTTSNGRPDVTGLDADGQKIIIIEGKFWANLTPNQPNNYLKELVNGGKLLFLAPDKRLGSLRIEIAKRLNGKNDKVVFSSWDNFLKLIEKENNRNHDHHLASDLTQMEELCKKMDTEGMPPLSPSDLDPMNGRVASHFADVIDECNPILRAWEHAKFTGLKTQGKKYGHGFYFRGYDFACFLSFDSYRWYTRDNHTPIWLDIKNLEWKETEKIKHALNYFDSDNVYGNQYGIVLHSGMDKEQVVAHIVNKVKEILGYLNDRFSVNELSENLKRFIDESTWVFAKTYAETWPHEYIVREKVDENLFLNLVKHIREHGYIRKFYKKDIVYFDYQNKVYWTMGNPIEETTIINRCNREQTYEYRLAHNDLPD